jgi:hypothetical protein
MRTTIDLPAELMQAAKIRAAQRAESLKDLFTRAVEREVGVPGDTRTRGRLTFPLIGSGNGPKVEVTNTDIETAFATEDVRRYVR